MLEMNTLFCVILDHLINKSILTFNLTKVKLCFAFVNISFEKWKLV